MAEPLASVVSDLKDKLAAGWTLSRLGNQVRATAPGTPDAAQMVVRCDSDADAQALLDAAQA